MKRIFVALIACIMAAPSWAETPIKEVTSPGGIHAWLVEEPSIPFTALEIRFKGGASLDMPGKRGATNLMMALLEEGSADRDSREFAAAVEELAASFEYDAYDDSVTVSAKFLTEDRDAAVALLRDSLVDPTFDQASVDRVRSQVLSIIQSDAKDPDRISSSAFYGAAYGDHPYGTSRNGTLESVEALTREDMFTAHKNAMALDRIFVSAVGDITEAELGSLMDTLLGDLPKTGGVLPDRAEFALEGGVTVIDFATPQAVAMFGHSGITRNDPDFITAYVLNTILGASSFESRLMTEVREKRGLTYGVYTYLVPKDLGEMVLGSVASANNRIAEAIDVIRAEWQRIATEGVTQEELDAAKTYLTGAYPLRFDGNGPIANIMVGMQMQGLPVDYIATRNDNVNAVTLDDIQRVAQRLLRPEELHFVVVGQPEGLSSASN